MINKPTRLIGAIALAFCGSLGHAQEGYENTTKESHEEKLAEKPDSPLPVFRINPKTKVGHVGHLETDHDFMLGNFVAVARYKCKMVRQLSENVAVVKVTAEQYYFRSRPSRGTGPDKTTSRDFLLYGHDLSDQAEGGELKLKGFYHVPRAEFNKDINRKYLVLEKTKDQFPEDRAVQGRRATKK